VPFVRKQEATVTEHSLLSDTIVHREYDITVREHAGSVAFTLGDLHANTAGARLARSAEARYYGLVAIFGVPDAPRFPLVWLATSDQIALAQAQQDQDLSEDIKGTIADKIDMFFADIALVVSELDPSGAKNMNVGRRPLN
jgi:hypothetical protein